MGQKVHPIGNRLGYIKTWDAKWFGKKNYRQNLLEDIKLREFVKRRLASAGVSHVVILRAGKSLRLDIHAARPGIIIGKRGTDVENLRKELEGMTSLTVIVNINPIKSPEVDAQIVAESIALQLEKQMSFRRVMKKAIMRSMAAGALGIKIMVAGRLGGAEIARTEWLREGRIPLQTLRADIDYGFTEARTTYGKIGVKVWIFRGEIIKKSGGRSEPVAQESRAEKQSEANIEETRAAKSPQK